MPNTRKTPYKPEVLQRFQTPRTIKGQRAYFLLTELRALVRRRELSVTKQFLAINLLLFMEGIVDHVPNFTGTISEPLDQIAPSAEVQSGIVDLFQTLKDEPDQAGEGTE